MNYNEIHLINTILINLPGQIPDYRYCPREEIAHPIKLQYITENSPTYWNKYIHSNNTFFVSWIPWYRKYTFYDEVIYTSVFHVLTEKPALFSLFQDTISSINMKDKTKDRESIEKLSQWLKDWWNEAFLITVPIMHSTRGSFICNSNYPYNNFSLEEYCPDDYLQCLLDNQAYTVGNGLILLLAYHRLKIIPARILQPILTEFLKDHEYYIYQNVNDAWHTLYYGTRIVHIADFSAFYICMGPDFAHENIINLFASYFDFNFPINNIYPNIIFYTTPYSAGFPYFNTVLWEQFRKIDDDWLSNIDYDESRDIVKPDIYGLIHGLLSTKTSWKYWLNNSTDILYSIAIVYTSMDKLFEDILQICSYYYTYGSHYHTRSLKKKVHQFWDITQQILDKDYKYSFSIFKKYALKYQVYERVKSIQCRSTLLINEIPYPLLKNIVATSNISENFYIKTKYIIMSGYIDILKRIYPDIEDYTFIEDDEILLVDNALIYKIPQYILKRSLIKFFKESSRRSVMNIFYYSYIEKRILSRLCAIYKAFGMYLNEHCAYESGTLYNNHTVGCIILEFLKNNKTFLIE